jgi:hypothetical protein
MTKPVVLELTLEAIGDILRGSEGGFAARSGPASVDTIAEPDRSSSPRTLTLTETATPFGFVILTTMCVPFDAAELVRLSGCLACENCVCLSDSLCCERNLSELEEETYRSKGRRGRMARGTGRHGRCMVALIWHLLTTPFESHERVTPCTTKTKQRTPLHSSGVHTGVEGQNLRPGCAGHGFNGQGAEGPPGPLALPVIVVLNPVDQGPPLAIMLCTWAGGINQVMFGYSKITAKHLSCATVMQPNEVRI